MSRYAISNTSRQRSNARNLFRQRMFERLEQRLMMNSDWRNPARPLDVNNDMFVSPLDALVVINALNSRGASSDLGARQNRLDSYLDTNGDRSMSPLDALIVINELNRSDRTH